VGKLDYSKRLDERTNIPCRLAAYVIRRLPAHGDFAGFEKLEVT
jgi:hypothetical protein